MAVHNDHSMISGHCAGEDGCNTFNDLRHGDGQSEVPAPSCSDRVREDALGDTNLFPSAGCAKHIYMNSMFPGVSRPVLALGFGCVPNGGRCVRYSAFASALRKDAAFEENRGAVTSSSSVLRHI